MLAEPGTDGLSLAMRRRVIEAREDERRRIARDVHDVVGQALIAVRLNLVRRMTDPDSRISGPLEDTVEVIDQAIAAVRACSMDLRPRILEDDGLESAIRWYLRRTVPPGLHATFISEASAARIDRDVELVCFRLFQEAMTNVLRHSRARRVSVVLSRTKRRIQLIVRDDGIGFDQGVLASGDGEASLGLTGMAERASLVAGTVRIRSAPGRGTTVRISIPVVVTAARDVGDPLAS